MISVVNFGLSRNPRLTIYVIRKIQKFNYVQAASIASVIALRFYSDVYLI